MPDVIDNVKVGLLIKKLLKERHMTQEQLAKLLNVSKSAVSQNLNGKSSFDIQNLMKISDIFNISLDELISQKSGGERDVISEYERVTKKGLDELKRVQPKDLNIKEPDLYGKVLVEYIIEYRKVDMFNYLHNANIPLFNIYHHQAQKVLLEVIDFMLENNIVGVENYIFDYTRRYGSFNVTNDDYRTKIMRLLNNDKKQAIVKTMMTEKVYKELKMMGIIKYKQAFKVMTKKQWIENIAIYQLHRVFTTYINLHDLYDDYPMIIEQFRLHNYSEGCHTCLDKMKKKTLTRFQLKQMHAQSMALHLAELNDLELFKKVIEKNLYSDINTLIRSLIINERHDMYAYCLNHETLPIDYAEALLAAIDKRNLDLLKRYIHKLTQDQKNYLLSQASAYDFEMIGYLLKEGAQFVTKYHNTETYPKINNYIQALLKGEKGEKENA